MYTTNIILTLTPFLLSLIPLPSASTGSTSILAAAQEYPVYGVWTGLDETTGYRPSRRNINDLHAEGGPMWDLYILGLAAFQDVPENQTDSYFQVSGIHGAPFSSWGGVTESPQNMGYCPHGENLFAPWHRPFVALFEQILHQHITHISATYNSTLYLTAAKQWRLPYWDWASSATLPPSVLTPTITVNAPPGKPTTIRNPLFGYQFQGFPYDAAELPRHYEETKRCMNSRGENVPSNANSQMGMIGGSLKDKVYNVFTRITDYDIMASTANRGGSFEDPHNHVHVFAGCQGGSMAGILFSAFDPLFMLHHTNIDRLTHLWETIHPSSFFSRSYRSRGQYGTSRGTLITSSSPLKPFRDENGAFWTPDTTRYVSAFGYSYPEVKEWEHNSAEDLRKSVVRRVNEMYGPGEPLRKRGKRSVRTKRAGGSLAAAAKRAVVEKTRQVEQVKEKEYFIEIAAQLEDLPLPCILDIKVGGKVAGSVSYLAMPEDGESWAEVPLKRILEDCSLAGLPNSGNGTADPVLEYVRGNFGVEIKREDGSVVDLATVGSLEISLQEEDVIPRKDDGELPTYVREISVEFYSGGMVY